MKTRNDLASQLLTQISQNRAKLFDKATTGKNIDGVWTPYPEAEAEADTKAKPEAKPIKKRTNKGK